MAEIDALDRRALGILSDTVSEQLGPTDLVSKDVRRAYTSGKVIDRNRAGSAFNSLPGWQRNMIGFAANDRARDVVRLQMGSTNRDWRDLELAERDHNALGNLSAPPPRFLLNRE